MLRRLNARTERWPLSRPFRISRGVKTAADVVVVELRDGGHIGRGESVPYARYGESVDSVLAQIASISSAMESGLTRADLQPALSAGAARNAVDCALWDLEAQQSGRSVAELAGLPTPGEIITAVTVSLDAPVRMAEAAGAMSASPLIKVKVDANDPLAIVEAVRNAAPGARLIVDPNESWTPQLLIELLPRLAALRVDLIEQPIPAAEDAALENLRSPVPICADESAHTSADLDRVARLYQAVNIKLDKTGGFTEALAMRQRARELGLTVMVGCMVSTSLGVAPALLFADGAAFVDLDGPWWLAQDREHGMIFRDGRMTAPRGGWGERRA
ncbi:MAG: dipeptide epimerase [Phycisphaerales bacterium]|nr:dipeptide epimerase [Hyphomonadaceae bacterium]